MARLFIEGFESGNLDLWPDKNNWGSIQILGSAGAYYVGDFWGNAANMYKWLPGRPAMYVAFKVYPNTGIYARDLWRFYDSTGWNMTLCRNTTSGYLEFYSGDRASLKATGTQAVPASTWSLVEFYYFPHASAGVFQSKVNGVADIDFSGITSPRTSDIWGLMLGTWSTPTYFSGFYDDIVVDDAEWIGNPKIILLSMAADEPDPQWTPSSGTSQFEMINEMPSNDSDYLKTNTVDQVSIFRNGGLSGMFSAIKCIQPCVRVVRQGESTATKVDFGISINGDGSSPRYGASLSVPLVARSFSCIDSNSLQSHYVLNTNPVTGLPWTRSEVDDLKFVIKSIA